MREAYGVPVVENENDLPAVLEQLGIRPWRQVHRIIDLDEYRSLLSAPRPIIRSRTGSQEESDGLEDNERQHTAQLQELERFAPKGEVLSLVPPGGGRSFTYFRSKGRNWVTVFATVPDPNILLGVRDEWRTLLVPIVAEWKHGAEIITITPPGGVPNEGESMEDCARREFLEETGFELAEVMALTPEPIAVSARQTTQQYVPYFGLVKEPVVRGPSRLDETELLKLILVPLPAWMRAISKGQVRECSAISTTFLALDLLGLLRLGHHHGSGMPV